MWIQSKKYNNKTYIILKINITRLDENAWKKIFTSLKKHLQGDKIERIPV